MNQLEAPNNVPEIGVIDMAFSGRDGRQDFVRKIQESKKLVEKIKLKILYIVGCFLKQQGMEDNDIKDSLEKNSDFIESIAKSCINEVAFGEDDVD